MPADPCRAVRTTTYTVAGRKRTHWVVDWPHVVPADVAGLPALILSAWQALSRGTLGRYVEYESVARHPSLRPVLGTDLPHAVGVLASQLKAVWLRDRGAISFTVDRMGGNAAFRINRPDAFADAPVGETDEWLNCTGDVVAGDTIRYREGVFSGSFRSPRFAGERVVTARVERESYGEDKQQHTFTLRVLSSEGTNPLAAGTVIRRKGRNIYRNGTERLRWSAAQGGEDARAVAQDEKHRRGNAARARREIRRSGDDPFNESPADTTYIHAVAVNRLLLTDGLTLDYLTIGGARKVASPFYWRGLVEALTKHYHDPKLEQALAAPPVELRFTDEIANAVDTALAARGLALAPSASASMRAWAENIEKERTDER